MGKLVHDAANWPHVDSGAVDLGAQEDLRGSVPKGDNLVGVTFEWKAERSGESKISYFDHGFWFINKEIRWLQITMHNSALMAMQKPAENLPDGTFDLLESHGLITFFKPLTHVLVKVLENKI